MLAALGALLSLGFARDSKEYTQAQHVGVRDGKHSGRNPGAFGGGKAAKSHRSLYVRDKSAA